MRRCQYGVAIKFTAAYPVNISPRIESFASQRFSDLISHAYTAHSAITNPFQERWHATQYNQSNISHRFNFRVLSD